MKSGRDDSSPGGWEKDFARTILQFAKLKNLQTAQTTYFEYPRQSF